jgi:pSer/pThr/pTyr-binding forkhead associated (FHA) protein
MRDGRTRRIATQGDDASLESLLANHRTCLVVVDGRSPGTEFEVREARTVFGRGPGVDVEVPDGAMSRHHFALEIGSDGVRVLDLGSTNGITVKGRTVESADLAHGDRFRAGDHEFQLVLEKIERQPRTYVVGE